MLFSSNIGKGNTVISVITGYVWDSNEPWNVNGRPEEGPSEGHQILAANDKYLSCCSSELHRKRLQAVISCKWY